MRARLSPAREVHFDSASISLHGLRPVINGTLYDDVEIAVTDVQGEPAQPSRIVLRMPLPALGRAAFSVAIEQEAAGRLALRYWLEGQAPGFVLDAFGICIRAVEGARAYLRSGYYSWDGAEYVAVGHGAAGPGYGLTQLLPRRGTGSVVLGFDRHDRFQHTFQLGATETAPSLCVTTLWDRKTIPPGGRAESERLVIFEHEDVEDALRAWAEIVAASAPVAPRVPQATITGWCSWYNLYASITEENILEHLRGAANVMAREGLPLRVFQIDDGFTPEMGDWLAVKPQFPRGMKAVLDEIRAAGLTPGLWIAPFMVGNRSRVFQEHPDWVVRDRETGGPLALMTFYGEFRWHKRSEEYYILDTTHPEAFDYLRHVFRTWRHEWGCEYFKTDFMHFPTVYGPERAVYHTPGLTRIEIWRRVAEMIREEIGDALWLGCGCPLWASVGLVDAIRIGRDVGVEWSGERSARSLLRDQAVRNFANHILWQADPDCILLRERYHHLSEAEQRSLAIYAGMIGGVTMTSDALHELSPERLRLWRLLVQPRRALCRFPLLGRPAENEMDEDPVRVQVRVPLDGAPDPVAIFVFNTGDTPAGRVYTLDRLGLPGPRYIVEWVAQQRWPEPVDRIAVNLAPHDGALFFVSLAPLETIPDRLP